MSTLFLRNRRLLALSIGLIIVAGGSALLVVPRQEDPTLTQRVATIIAPYPGASAAQVEALVTEALEDELSKLSEIKTLSSVSKQGLSAITIELEDTVLAPEPVFSELRDAMADAARRLPEGALAPRFDDERFGAYTLISALRWHGEGPAPLAVMRRFAREFERSFRATPGTKTVNLWGAPKEVVDIRYDPQRLAQAGLSPARLAHAIRASDTRLAAGTIDTGRHRLFVEIAGKFDDLGQIRRIPVQMGPSGVVHLSDLATVTRRIETPASEYLLSDGRPAIALALRMETDRQVGHWTRSVEAKIRAYQSRLPQELSFDVLFRQASYTQTRLIDLVKNLFVGIALVFFVLLFTVGLRAACIVATALPLTSLLVMYALRLLGIPIHQMSVTGLIVALGLLVDNAIVVVDSIRYRRSAGDSAMEAVDRAVRELWLPLLSSTLTTVLAFGPILLLPGGPGEFVGPIAASVVLAVLCSYALAMTVTAALGGLLLRPAAGRFSHGLRLPWLTRWYQRSLATALKRPLLSALLVTLPALLGLGLMGTLENQFFPPSDRNQFVIQVELASHSTVERTRRTIEAVQRRLSVEPAIRQTNWFIGRSAPAFYYNLKEDQDGNAAFAEAQVTTRDYAASARLMPRLQRMLTERFPEARVIVRELSQGPPVDAPIELRVYGQDLDTLRQLGESLRERLSRVPSVTFSRATLEGGSPTVVLQSNAADALRVGYQLGEIAQEANDHLNGVHSGRMLESTESIDLILRAEGSLGADVSAVETLPLRASSASAPGLLQALGETSLEARFARIPHRDSERINSIRAYLDPGVLPERALKAFRLELERDPVALPAGYRMEFGGDAEKRSEAVGNLVSSVGVLAILMLTILVLSFASFRYAGVIFMVAGQSFGLGILALSVSPYPFGFQSIIGALGLIGVAINDAIVILTILKNETEGSETDLASHVQKLVVDQCGRHVVSTTLTTAAGFLPLLLSTGGFWPPFAVVIAGGVSLSTLTSLYFVPAVFTWLNRSKHATAQTPQEISPCIA